MSDLWRLVILFSVLQTGVWSDEVLSVTCNDTFWVQLGESVTISCVIKWHDIEQKCYHVKYNFTSNNVNMCDPTLSGNVCESDDMTYISLSIPEVLKVEKIDVEVSSICGMDHTSLTVQPYGERQKPPPSQLKNKPKLKTEKGEPTQGDGQGKRTAIIFVVVVLIVVIIVLCVVYRNSVNKRICPHGV